MNMLFPGVICSSSTWQVGGNITGGLENNSFTNITTTVQTTGNSIVYILMMVIGFVGVIGFGIAAVKIMVGGSNTKATAKGDIFWIIVAAVLGFGAMAIIGLLQTVGVGLFM